MKKSRKKYHTTFTLRLSNVEKIALFLIARHYGYNVSDYLRSVARGFEPDREVCNSCYSEAERYVQEGCFNIHDVTDFDPIPYRCQCGRK